MRRPLGRRDAPTGSGGTKKFGWIPPRQRAVKQWEAHEKALCVALAPPDDYEAQGGTAYVSAGEDAAGGFLRCVLGHLLAGEGLLDAVTACLGGPNPPPPPPPPPPNPGKLGHLWWLYTYGQSRLRGGMTDEGEGSFGSAWAAAIREDGIFFEEETPETEEWRDVGKWMQTTEQMELRWSAGGWSKQKYGDLARVHPVTAVTAVKNIAEALDHLKNGRCITLASEFGTRTIRRQGSPSVMLAEWDDTWPHQMSCSDGWDHSDLGPILDIDNNWGPQAHPAPVSGEDPGGFWINERTFNRICQTGEVYAFGGFRGLRANSAVTNALKGSAFADTRYNVKALAKRALGEFYRRIWQVTGSCVGAGGGTMLTHLMGAEMAVTAGPALAERRQSA